MHFSFLDPILNYIHGDGLVVLPQMELLLFALGILIFDFLLEKREKHLNAFLALLGIAASSLGLFMQFQKYRDVRVSQMGPPVLIGFHNTAIVDGFFLVFAMIFLAATALVILLSVRYLNIEKEQEGEYYALLLFSCIGMMFMASGIDLIVLFLGLETMALSFYAMVGFLRREKRSNEAAVLRAKIIHILIVLSLIGIIYGAIVCLMQKDMKRLIAYSSVSHLGFCTLGIFALTPLGLSGSVLQQINHGISTGALFLLVGIIYERRHTRLISEFGGLATPMPNFAAIYLIITLSSLGMPILNGFIGEFTILQGVFVVNKAWAAWGTLGIVLGAAYLLWLYQRVMFGNVTHDVNKTLPDLNVREYAVLLPLVALAFWIGIYPEAVLRLH